MPELFIGQLQPWGCNFAPRGFMLCEGQLLPIAQYTALFSLLGTTFGGDGRTTFGLPDLRGRAPIGIGRGPGLSNRTWGEKGGTTTVTLTPTQIPSHNHIAELKGTETDAGATLPTGNALANAREDTYVGSVVPNKAMEAASVALGNTGGGQSHDNMQPYLVINWCIAIQGLYPSRS